MNRPLAVVFFALISAVLLDIPPFDVRNALSLDSAQGEYRIDGVCSELSRGQPSGTGVLDAYLAFQKRSAEPGYTLEVLPEFTIKPEDAHLPAEVCRELFARNLIILPAAYDIPDPATTWLLGTCIFGMVLVRRGPNRKSYAAW